MKYNLFKGTAIRKKNYNYKRINQKVRSYVIIKKVPATAGGVSVARKPYYNLYLDFKIILILRECVNN